MKINKHEVEVGIFAENRENLETFVSNLCLSEYFNESIKNQLRIEREYAEALMMNDNEKIQEKEYEMEMYKASLQLTHHLFTDTESA